MMKKENYKLLAEEVLEKASLKGANFSDVVIIGNISKNIGCRLGKVEEIEQSETQILGLRTFIGKKNAITSTNNFNKESINETIDRVIEMTKLTPDDPLPGLANETTKKIPELDLYDDTDYEEVIEYTFEADEKVFEIHRGDDAVFEITGKPLRKIFEMTDFTKDQSVKRFSRQLRSLGVDAALRERGVENGDTVRIFDYEFEFID